MFGNLLKKFFGGTSVPYTSLQVFVPNMLKWMNRSSKTYMAEGYMQNGIVYRCIRTIAEDIASIPLQLENKNGERIDDHPVLDLLRQPNATQAYCDFVERMISFYLGTGNTFQEVITDGGGIPRELWVWQPYQMSIKSPENPSPIPAAYMWKDGTSKKTWEVDKITGKSDILHIKTFHPFDRWFGMAPMEAAAWSVDQHNSAAEWNQRLLQNLAAPPGALKVEGELSDEAYQRLQHDIERNYSGSSNAGRPMIFEGGATWIQMGMSAKDMDWLEGKKMSALDICSVFDVPGQVVNVPDSQTYANYEQARLFLWEDNIIPTAKKIYNEWSNWLLPRYGAKGLRIVGDLDEIPALEPRRKERWDKAQNAEFITVNEKRRLVGFEDYESEDDTEPANRIWVNSGMLPIEEMGVDLGSEEEFTLEEPDDIDEELEQVNEEIDEDV